MSFRIAATTIAAPAEDLSSFFKQAITSSQSSVTAPTLAKTVPNSFSFQGVVIFSKTTETAYKGKNGKKDGVIASTQVTVIPQNLCDLAREHPNSQVYRLNAAGTGVRMLKSHNVIKKDIAEVYMAGMQEFKRRKAEADVALPVIDLSADDIKFVMDFSQEPFALHPSLELLDGVPVDIEIRGKIPLRVGTLVSVEGVHVSPWISDPAKSKYKAADGEVEVAAPVAVEQRELPLWAVGDPVSKKNIHFTLNAASAIEVKCIENDLPFKWRLPIWFDVAAQQWSNPAEATEETRFKKRGVFVVNVKEDADEPVFKGERGSFVGANQYQMYISKESRASTASEPVTFFWIDTKNNDRQKACMPINFLATNWEILPADDPNVSVNATDLPDGRKMNMKTFMVRSRIWQDQCRDSGIADLDAWIDVNTYHPIPVTTLMRLSDKTSQETAIGTTVIVSEFDMETYLRMFAVPVTSAFVCEAFDLKSGATVLHGPSTFGSEINNQNQEVQILNTGNMRQRDFMLNLTEYNGDIAHVLKHENKWDFAALLVPINRKVTNPEAQLKEVERRTKFLDSTKPLLEAETPEAGDKAIKDWLQTRAASGVSINELGHQSENFRCIIFAFKRFENRFSAAVRENLTNARHAAPAVVEDAMEIEGEGEEVRGVKRKAPPHDEEESSSHAESKGGKANGAKKIARTEKRKK